MKNLLFKHISSFQISSCYHVCSFFLKESSTFSINRQLLNKNLPAVFSHPKSTIPQPHTHQEFVSPTKAASWVFKNSCRSKLMVRIRAVAHELHSCSTSSFRSGEATAIPAIQKSRWARGVLRVVFLFGDQVIKQKTNVVEDQVSVR